MLSVSSGVPVRLARLITFVVALAMGWMLLMAPVAAQRTLKAPILLDGRQILEVSESGRYEAEERAEEVNRILARTVDEADEIEVGIDRSGTIPRITINGRHLLSVTTADAPKGRTTLEQAEIWQRRIEQAVEQAKYERRPIYLAQAVVLSAIAVGIALALNWGVGWLWHRWIHPRLERESPPPQHPSGHVAAVATAGDELGARVVLVILRAIVWLAAIVYIADLFPQTRRLIWRIVNALRTSLTAGVFPLGENSYSVIDVLVLLGLFGLLVALSRTVRRVLRLRVLSLTGLGLPAQETIAAIANYGFILVGAIVVLQIWGLDISSLTVFAGVLGVGIGLGIQGVAKEFVSGLVLIFERPIQVGDFVDVEGLVGTVEQIGIRSTEISTLDRISVILPNSRFLEAEVINWSHRNPVSRLKLRFGVAYGSDLSAVRGAMLQAAKEHPDVLSLPAPNVFFIAFGDSSLDLDLLVWISEPRKQFQIRSDLYFRVEALFRDRHVEVPFPQRDLHVRSGSLPVEMSPQLVDSLSQLSSSLSLWLEHQTNGNGKSPLAKEKTGNGE